LPLFSESSPVPGREAKIVRTFDGPPPPEYGVESLLGLPESAEEKKPKVCWDSGTREKRISASEMAFLAI
jgi:hypothetical protein